MTSAEPPATVHRPTPPSDRKPDPVPRAVGRVLDLLEIVLAARSCTLTAAASAAGLTPTTALRHLRALEARGYLRRDADGAFSAGPTLVRIAATIDAAGPLARVVAAAQPHLEALARRTGESTYLAVGDRDVATYLAVAESPRAIRHVGWVGQHVPLAGTAVGAALASPGTCAVRHGAVEADITAISCALPTGGTLPLAVSVVGPTHRLDADRCESAVHALAAAVAELAEEVSTT